MPVCEFTVPNPKCLKCRLVPKKSICDVINSSCFKAKCFNCGKYFIMQKFININEPANYGEDLDGNKYCFTCYRKLCVDVEVENSYLKYRNLFLSSKFGSERRL